MPPLTPADAEPDGTTPTSVPTSPGHDPTTQANADVSAATASEATPTTAAGVAAAGAVTADDGAALTLVATDMPAVSTSKASTSKDAKGGDSSPAVQEEKPAVEDPTKSPMSPARSLFSGLSRRFGSQSRSDKDLEAGLSRHDTKLDKYDYMDASDSDDDSAQRAEHSGDEKHAGGSRSGGHDSQDESEARASRPGRRPNLDSAMGAVGTTPASPTAPARTAESVDGKNNGDGVVVQEVDEKAARDAHAKPLRRRVADIMFYWMAFLDVSLPLLFVALAILIFTLNNQPVSSGWFGIENAIRAAITIWPIAFATVVAQAFKTWATWKVERGVKLGELEQLVGSNSFGGALKQPFLLNRFDFLTLGVFLTWCLSPIGSQALQRTYSIQRGIVEENLTVSYLEMYGHNRLFAPDSQAKLLSAGEDETMYASLMEAAAVFYIGSFMPLGADAFAVEDSRNPQTLRDQYSLPFLRGPVLPDGASVTPTSLYSGYGIPVAMPLPSVTVSNSTSFGTSTLAPFENVTFPINSSFFNLTCNPWQDVLFAALNHTSMPWSISETLAINFTWAPDNSTIDRIGYATLTDQEALNNITGNPQAVTYPQSDWQYLYIDCALEQVFVTANITCQVDTLGGSFLWSCENTATQALESTSIPPDWYTNLTDFSFAFASSGSPEGFANPTTPTERYANKGIPVDGTAYRPNATDIKTNTPPQVFARNLGYLFNTWVTIGYCPECVTLNPALQGAGGGVLSPSITSSLFAPATATHLYSGDPIFVTDMGWATVTLVGAVVLLVVGVAGVVLDAHLVTPDTLGYVSTVVRNSRYLGLPKIAQHHGVGLGGNAAAAADVNLTGMELSRALRNVEVMMQDVKADAEVGKIALGMKTDGAVRVQPGRLYR